MFLFKIKKRGQSRSLVTTILVLIGIAVIVYIIVWVVLKGMLGGTTTISPQPIVQP